MPALLGPLAYRHVFEPYRGQAICLFKGAGNVGDELIEAATLQLLERFEIRRVAELRGAAAAFYLGGGNMGRRYRLTYARRRRLGERCRREEVPLVILPQSWTSPDDVVADRFFAREAYSLEFCPEAELAPDLALAYEAPFDPPSLTEEQGAFFRRDGERALPVRSDSRGDPAKLAATVEDYLKLAGSFEIVHTDRLHFAIAALLMGRRAVLYPNAYFKNRGVFEMWLRGRACEWGVDAICG